MRIIFFIILLGISYAKQCTFTPPQGWEIAQLKTLSPHVKIGFLGKGSSEFRPSINLALESGVDVSLKEYVKAVKEIQAGDPTSSWRDLGPFPTSSGNGRLIEITNTSPWGEIKVLQLLVVRDETAYILTAAVLKEDLLKFQKEILQSFKTLELTDDLLSQISDLEKQKELRGFFATLGSKSQEAEWEHLQKLVAKHSDLGAYWVYQILQEGYAKIYSAGPSEPLQSK